MLNSSRVFTLASIVFISGAAGAQQTDNQQTVTFDCASPAGHTCQFGVRTKAGTVLNFGLSSGDVHQLSGIVPGEDTYCVCDPTPVTADCKAPDPKNWCSGSWRPVTAGIN